MDNHPVLEGDQFDDGKSSSGDHDDSMPSMRSSRDDDDHGF